jgi:GNAT superfamily N-acetyltransferase
VTDVHGECPELLAPGSGPHGALWVLPEGAWVAACVGWRPTQETGVAELVKLYVAHHRRGAGLGRALTGLVEQQARDRGGATTVELWSDSRFAAAHRLYEAQGYQATGQTRQLGDLSRTTEYHYRKALASKSD